MPKTMSLVRFGKSQYKTWKPIYTGVKNPEGLFYKLLHSFRYRGTAVEQSIYKASARLTLMAGISTVVVCNY